VVQVKNEGRRKDPIIEKPMKKQVQRNDLWNSQETVLSNVEMQVEALIQREIHQILTDYQDQPESDSEPKPARHIKIESGLSVE